MFFLAELRTQDAHEQDAQDQVRIEITVFTRIPSKQRLSFDGKLTTDPLFLLICERASLERPKHASVVPLVRLQSELQSEQSAVSRQP